MKADCSKGKVDEGMVFGMATIIAIAGGCAAAVGFPVLILCIGACQTDNAPLNPSATEARRIAEASPWKVARLDTPQQRGGDVSGPVSPFDVRLTISGGEGRGGDEELSFPFEHPDIFALARLETGDFVSFAFSEENRVPENSISAASYLVLPGNQAAAR